MLFELKNSFIICKRQIRYCLEALTERSVNEDSIVELSRGGSDVNCLHLLKTTQGVALRDKFGNRSLMQGAGDEQNNVVDHVAVPI